MAKEEMRKGLPNSLIKYLSGRYMLPFSEALQKIKIAAGGLAILLFNTLLFKLIMNGLISGTKMLIIPRLI